MILTLWGDGHTRFSTKSSAPRNSPAPFLLARRASDALS